MVSEQTPTTYTLTLEDAIEIAKQVSKKLLGRKLLTETLNPIQRQGSKKAILELSDWHYGIDIDSYYNEYNPQIAKDRLSDLLMQVIKIVNEQRLKKLIIVNLGDLIAGRIHLTIRFNSRIDVIT